jgi:hypothetical protein
MELKCPECGAAIAEADLNLKAGLAACRACDRMFVVTRRGEQLVAAPADTVPERAESAKEAAATPAGFTASEHDGVLTISFRPKGFGQGWQLLSVAFFAIIFAGVLARDVLLHRPPVFHLLLVGAALLAATSLVMLIGGLYVTFGTSTVTMSRAEGVFGRRLFGFTWSERVSLEGITRVQPFRMRQRTRIELFTCGLMIGERRAKFFCDLGDTEMFQVADVVNGFLKRANAESFAKAIAVEEEGISRKGAKAQR